MTVAFEFEEKKEDDENAGKVKVNLLIFVSSFFSLFLFVHCYYSDRLWTHWLTFARRSDTSSSLMAVLFLIAGCDFGSTAVLQNEANILTEQIS